MGLYILYGLFVFKWMSCLYSFVLNNIEEVGGVFVFFLECYFLSFSRSLVREDILKRVGYGV